MTDVSSSQFLKASFPTKVTVFEVLADKRLVHPANARSSMETIESGTEIDERLTQFSNAQLPINETLPEKVTDESLLQLAKAMSPIEKTSPEKVIDNKLSSKKNNFD